MAEFQPNPQFVALLKVELEADLLEVGKAIASRVPDRVRIHRYGGPKVEVGAVDDAVVVARMEPWAAIDEFGGSGLEPTAALRNACLEQPGALFTPL